MAFLIPEIYLIDGENLVNRFQAMQEGGHKPKPDIIHIPDVFVWSPSIMTAVTGDIGDVRRVSYYTSAVGDDERIAAIESQIRSFTYTCKGEKFSRINALFPRVFKKHGKTRRSRSVDINIVIDALRYTRAGTIGIVGLVSGDADFAPLVTELSHSG